MKPWLQNSDIEIYSIKEVFSSRKIYQNFAEQHLQIDVCNIKKCVHQ